MILCDVLVLDCWCREEGVSSVVLELGNGGRVGFKLEIWFFIEDVILIIVMIFISCLDYGK